MVNLAFVFRRVSDTYVPPSPVYYCRNKFGKRDETVRGDRGEKRRREGREGRRLQRENAVFI